MEPAAEPEARVSGGRFSLPGTEEGRGAHLGGGLGPTDAALRGSCRCGGSRRLPTGAQAVPPQQEMLLSTRRLPRARGEPGEQPGPPSDGHGAPGKNSHPGHAPLGQRPAGGVAPAAPPCLAGTWGPPRRGQGPSFPAGHCAAAPQRRVQPQAHAGRWTPSASCSPFWDWLSLPPFVHFSLLFLLERYSFVPFTAAFIGCFLCVP